MRRPIIPVCLLFIIGIYLGSQTDIPIYLSLCIGLFCWIATFFCLFFNKSPEFLLSFLAIFLIATSVSFYDCRTVSFPPSHIKDIATPQKSLQRIRGVILKPPIILYGDARHSNKANNNHKFSLILKVNEIKTATGWKDITGNIKVNMYLRGNEIFRKSETSSVLHKLVYGQEVELTGYLFLPKPPGNPGEFNYKKYLKRQMPPVYAYMTIINVRNVKILGVNNHNHFYDFVYTLKNYFNNTIYTHAFSSSAPLISSMLLGNRINLSQEIIDAFAKTGIIHFLAISGFHVGIVILTILLPFRILGVNKTATTCFILLVIILYAFLTGLNPPVQRASIMAAVFFCSYLFRRKWDITSSIFTAMFFILIRNPSDLFSAGFQLSILATIGIIYGTPRIESALFKTTLFIEKLQVPEERGKLFYVKKYLRKFFCVSLAAWLATMPLVAYYFHIFNPYIPIISIAAFPFFWIIIVSGIILLTLGTFIPLLASVSAWLASHADVILESIALKISSLPYSHFSVIGPSQTTVIAYYLLILLLFYRKYLSVTATQITIWGLLSANILVFSNILKPLPRSLSVTCLEVGHGAAVFIQFPNGKNILYDAGTWHNYDVGKYIIAPFLWEKKIKKIDLVILSHEHNDHWNGLPSIVERFDVDLVYTQPYFFDSEAGKDLIPYLEKKHIQTAALTRGMVIKGYEPARIEILHPSLFAPEITRPNDTSCVLKIDYLDYGILLCGDIQRRGIKAVISNGANIKSDIIQIPHHGSYLKKLKNLVTHIQPTYAFINSHRKIISNKTIDLLRRQNVTTLMSHKAGAITLSLNKDNITYSVYKKGAAPR